MTNRRTRAAGTTLSLLAALGLAACAAHPSSRPSEAVWRASPRGEARVHDRQPQFDLDAANGAAPITRTPWRASPRGPQHVPTR